MRGVIKNCFHFEVRKSKQALTTSMICCSVRPNFTSSGSDSLATGRSKTLYGPSRLLSSRFSCGPCSVPAT